MTPYSEVYGSFLGKIEDKDLPLFEDADRIRILTGWLNTAIAYIELDGLEIESNLSDRDNDAQVFNSDLMNCEVEVIAMYMVAAWYEPKINSLENTLMFVGSSGEKWSSQKDRMNMLKETQKEKKLEARKYFVKYGYKNNSYIKGEE